MMFYLVLPRMLRIVVANFANFIDFFNTSLALLNFPNNLNSLRIFDIEMSVKFQTSGLIE